MPIHFKNLRLSAFLVLFVITALLSSCANNQSDLDKYKNADNDELLTFLKDGNVQERRQASAILRNNVKQENVKALAAAISSDSDKIVVGNCATSLAKIGNAESVNILTETILSFDDFRVSTCAVALASHRISKEVIDAFNKIIKNKPDQLFTIVRNLNTTNTSSFIEFQNMILVDHKKYPEEVVATIIDQVGKNLDNSNLPMLFDIYYNSDKHDLQRKAEHTIDLYPEDVRTKMSEKYDEILVANAKKRAEEIKAKQIQRTRRLEKLKPPIPYEEMKNNAMYKGAVFVDGLELVKDYATIGHPGGFNGEENEGELIAYNVRVKSNTDSNFNQLSGYCYSYDDSVTVLNRRIYFNKVKGGSSKISENQLMVLIAPGTAPDTPIELFFQFGESKSDVQSLVMYSMTEITVNSMPFGPFSFEVSSIDDDQWGVSEGNGDGILDWGETCEMLVTLRNLGEATIAESQLEIISMNQLGRLENNRINLGEIVSKNEEGAAGVFSLSLSSEYEGKYDLNLLLKLHIIKANKIIGTWMQILKVTVGESKPELIGQIKSYEQFSIEKLVDVFVINQNNETMQENFLFNTEVEYKDAKSSLILDDYVK